MNERVEEAKIRRSEEFAFDLNIESDFVVVRVDIVEGEKIGSLVGESDNQEAADAMLETDQLVNPGAAYYHLFGPRDFLDKREGWIVGGEIDD